jgi:3-hydroxyacyl-[acyl-carrier-protein] dehydratase
MANLKTAIQQSAKGPVHEKEPGTFIQSFCFGPEFIGFAGHFPGYPILPAFIQILTVQIMAEEVQGRRLKVMSLEKAKFQKEIFPGKEIEVQFREKTISGKTKLEATLTVSAGQAASFLLVLDNKF